MADFEIKTDTRPLSDIPAPLLAVPVFADEDGAEALDALDTSMEGAVRRIFEHGDFRGRKGDRAVLYPSPGAAVAAERVLLIGCGRRADYSAEALRRSVGTAVREAERLRVARIAVSIGHSTGVSGLDARTSARVAAEAAGLWISGQVPGRRLP